GDAGPAERYGQGYTRHVEPTPYILRWDGRSWKRNKVAGGAPLRAITGTAANDVWTVGDRGTVLRWDEKTWSSVPSGTEADLLAVAKTKDGTVWIGGGNGRRQRLVWGQDIGYREGTGHRLQVWGLGGELGLGKLVEGNQPSRAVKRCGGEVEKSQVEVVEADGNASPLRSANAKVMTDQALADEDGLAHVAYATLAAHAAHGVAGGVARWLNSCVTP